VKAERPSELRGARGWAVLRPPACGSLARGLSGELLPRGVCAQSRILEKPERRRVLQGLFLLQSLCSTSPDGLGLSPSSLSRRHPQASQQRFQNAAVLFSSAALLKLLSWDASRRWPQALCHPRGEEEAAWRSWERPCCCCAIIGWAAGVGCGHSGSQSVLGGVK